MKIVLIKSKLFLVTLLLTSLVFSFYCNARRTADGKTNNHSQIKKILSFKEICELNLIPENETVIFVDIDDVIITPVDWSLRSCDKKNPFKIIKLLMAGSISDDVNKQGFFQDRLSTLYLNRKVKLVEDAIPEYLNIFRSLGYQVIGITQINVGRCGKLNSVEDWRIEELRQLKVNFEKLNTYFIKNDYKKIESCPVKGGIIFTDKLSKGDCIKSFLSNNPQVKNVILIDDLYRNHKDAINKIKNINYIGYHYIRAKKLFCKINQEFLTLQLNKLLYEDVWMPCENE